MKEKVLLVTSSFEHIAEGNVQGELDVEASEKTYYPLGLAYLHSYLESKEIEVETLPLNYVSGKECIKEVLSKIKTFSPDILGLNLLTSNRVSSYKLIEEVHKRYPRLQIVLGGIHSTIMYEQLIEKFPYIIVVLGEGEITFEELIKELGNKSPDLNKIDGLAFWKGDGVGRTPPRRVIQDLDILPFPKHDMFFKSDKRKFASLLTTRGCFFSCSFCCLNPETKRMVRYRSPENVVDEIEYLTINFPQIEEIIIQDDSFFVDNERVIKICDEIIRRKIKMSFVCSGRIKPVSKEMIKKLEQANFRTVMVGIETCNDEMLRRAHKGISKADIVKTFKLFKKSKLNIKTFLIVGLPGETKETILEACKFMQQLQRIKYVSFPPSSNILVIYPGTEVYEIAKEQGIIDDDFWLGDQEIPFYTGEHSVEELRKFGETLANHISYYKLKTWDGFKAQYLMIPYVIEYVLIRILAKMKGGKNRK